MNGELNAGRNVVSRRSRAKKSGKKKNSAELKVVYISSPMKVRTCASNFRSTVQQLTGRDSDLVDRLMEEYANNEESLSSEIVRMGADEYFLDAGNGDRGLERLGNDYESPTSSGTAPFEDVTGAFCGGGGEGFSFDEIFGEAGFLLECPLDESVFGGM